MSNLKIYYNNYFNNNFSNFSGFRSDDKIKKIIKLAGQNKRILDIGCSTGYLAHFLKNNGNNVSGIDFLDKAVLIAKQNKIDAYVCDIENEKLPFKDNSFDLVIFSEVIEHLVDPDIALKKIYQVLKNNGLLIVSTPNIAYIQYRFELLFGKLPDFCEFRNRFFERHYNFQHKSLFTTNVLKKTLLSNNFLIKKWSSHNAYKNRVEKIFTFMEYVFPNLFKKNLIVVAQKYDAEDNHRNSK